MAKLADPQSDQQRSTGLDCTEVIAIQEEDNKNISSLGYGQSESFPPSRNIEGLHEGLRQSRRQNKHPCYAVDSEDDQVKPLGAGPVLAVLLTCGPLCALLYRLTHSSPSGSCLACFLAFSPGSL